MNKTSKTLRKFPYLPSDLLWFVLLLTPLFVIAIMIYQQVHPTMQQGASQQQSAKRGIEMVVGAVDISTTELASIIAKPLGELIAMEVYSAVGGRVNSAANVQETYRQTSHQQLSEIRPMSVNPVSTISYVTDENPTRYSGKEAS